jgi:hypothetical protein
MVPKYLQSLYYTYHPMGAEGKVLKKAKVKLESPQEKRTKSSSIDNTYLKSLSPLELLRIFAAIIEELRTRGICRTLNNPVADYAEWLVSERLGMSLEKNSSAGFDAVDPDGIRYEIKSRRIAPKTPSTQLSAIRNLKIHHFDYLIAILFDVDFSIIRALKIPYEVVLEKSIYRAHTNAYILHLRNSVLNDERVEDITGLLTGS